MKRTHARSSKSNLKNKVTKIAALLMAHGLAATAARAQEVSASTTGEGDNEEPIDLPDYTVEDEETPQLSSPKFTTALRDLPQMITIIPQKIIEEQGATSLREILRNSPGITFQAGEGGTPAGDQMTIRGFSARTDIYVDGVRDLGGYARDSFNTEQVEVSKGPSSAVAGRGSTGGSVNLVTKSPRAFSFQNVDAAIGTDDYYRATVDVNEPLSSEGKSAFRMNGMWQKAGVPGRDVAENNSWGFAPSLGFGLGTPTQVTLSYQHMEQDNVPDYGIPRQAFDYDPPVPYSNFYGLTARDYENIDQDLATVNVTHHFNEEITLNNLTRFGRTYRDSVITAPRFVSGSTDVIRRSDWKSRDQTNDVLANHTNVSFRVRTGDINHVISTGLELSGENEKNRTRVEDPDAVLPETDVYNPNPNDPYDGNITRNGAYTQGSGDTVALYAFDTLNIGEQWQVTGGLRYDNFYATQDIVSATNERTHYSRRDEVISSRIGVVYKPVPVGTFYAGFADSFNPTAEGLSLGSATSNLSSLAPEKTRTYEIGTKWDTFEGRLSLAGALFRTEKTNARTPGIDPNDPPQVLEGKQRVGGLELSAAGRLTRSWDVFAGLAIMDSEVEESNNEAEAGEELGLTPNTSFNLWTSYRFPFGVTIGGGTQYMDSVFRNSSSGETVPSYWLLNAMASYDVTERMTLRLNFNNILDEQYIDRVGGGHHIPGTARQLILSTNVSF